MLAVVLVVGLLIGGGVGWFMKPSLPFETVVDESPVHPEFSESLPENMEDAGMLSYTMWESGEYKDYLLVYWVERGKLYWTYLEVSP